MYWNLRNAVEQRTKKNLEEVERNLRGVRCGEALGNWYYKSLMTDVARRLIFNSEMDEVIPPMALRKMLGRASNAERKQYNSDVVKIEQAEEAEMPDLITVSVEWTRSKTWGANPTATVRAGGFSTYGKASGCGYDKESAAVASAMNKNPSVLKVWYENADAGGRFRYSVSGIERGYLPCMDGGCGMDATIAVFEALGYKCEQQHGKHFDYYTFSRK